MEFLEAREKTNHQNSWSKLWFKCLTKFEFLSFPVICSFHLILQFPIFSPVKSAPHEHTAIYDTTIIIYFIFIIKEGLYFSCIPYDYFFCFVFRENLDFSHKYFSLTGEYGTLTEKVFLSSDIKFWYNHFFFSSFKITNCFIYKF